MNKSMDISDNFVQNRFFLKLRYVPLTIHKKTETNKLICTVTTHPPNTQCVRWMSCNSANTAIAALVLHMLFFVIQIFISK